MLCRDYIGIICLYSLLRASKPIGGDGDDDWVVRSRWRILRGLIFDSFSFSQPSVGAGVSEGEEGWLSQNAQV